MRIVRNLLVLLALLATVACGGTTTPQPGGGGGSSLTMADLLKWKGSHVSTPDQPVTFTEEQFAAQFGHPKITPTGKPVPVGVGETVQFEVALADGTTEFLVNMVTKDALAKMTSEMSSVNRAYWEGKLGQCELVAPVPAPATK